MVDKFFGIKLKELRKQQGFTQLQLAELLGVSKTTICQWETKKQEPSITDIKKLCSIFDETADYLLGLEYEDETNSYTNNGIDNRQATINGGIFTVNNKK